MGRTANSEKINDFFNRQEGISAGYFEDRPFLDRINPFTPIQSKRFVPSEEAKILLDNFKERTGKNVNVLPLRENFNKFKNTIQGFESVGGVFPSSDLIGGPLDPRNRDIYLNKDYTSAGAPSLFVLAHELGHADDAELKSRPGDVFRDKLSNAFGNITKKRFAGSEEFPGYGVLHETYKKDPLEIFRNEIKAQKYAKDAYENLGVQDDFSKGDLFNYPYSYIQNFNKEFIRPQLPQLNIPEDANSDEAFQFFDERAKQNAKFRMQNERFAGSRGDLINQAKLISEEFDLLPKSQDVFISPYFDGGIE
tara:strand:+ start:2106 stop:3029 length:924 start_codon:yes stop_codon:yes gene_type:complete